MKRHIIMFILFCWYSVAAATITTEIEPSSIQLGETVRVTFTQDDTRAGGVPDLIPLERDFTIVGTERSTSYTAINGQARSMSQWSVLLIPKRTGTLPIPAIRIGSQQSLPNQIIVHSSQVPSSTDKHSIPSNKHDDVILTVEVSSKKPLINEQVIYTVKLLNRQQLLNADYQPPHVNDAIMVPLGDGRHYQTVLNGYTYGVEEQQYAIFPQKSGILEITPPSFKAMVYDDGMPKPIDRQGEAIKLNVKAMPAHHSRKFWLPAKQITLTEHYDKTQASVEEGTPIIRTVTLQASALPAELLPVLTFPDEAHVSVYAEKPIIKNRLKQQTVVGTARIKITYIPNQTGHITIPAINLAWFNTTTGKDEVASLPSRIIDVTPNVSVKMNVTTEPNAPAEVSLPTKHYASVPWMTWLALLFASLWVLTLGLWWAQRGTVGKKKKKTELKQLKEACTHHHPIQERAALMAWAQVLWPDLHCLSLTDVSNQITDEALKKQLHLLMLALYSQDGMNAWRGDELWRCIVAFKPQSSRQQTTKQWLPSLWSK